MVILFEAWGWEPLQRMVARLTRLPRPARLERRIAALPPGPALSVLVVPALAPFPVKLLSLWFIGRGPSVMGVLLITGVKLVGTAVVGRLFCVDAPGADAHAMVRGASRPLGGPEDFAA